MSIPPLVCSTPPPPDQCEDDKDPEDFDIQYNLSQDDDDDNYDFGSFSTYNHFQSSQSKTDAVIHKVVENKNNSDSSKELKDIENDEINLTSKQKLEEETNIEDLHLEDLKVDEVAVESIDVIETNIEGKISKTSKSVQEIEIPECLTDSPHNSQASPIQIDEFIIEPSSIDQSEEPPSYVDEIIAAVDDMQITPNEPDLPLQIAENEDSIQESNVNEPEIPVLPEPVIESKFEVNVDDNFGDFEDFQFASPVDKPMIVDSCDSPWNKIEGETTGNDFGDFKANFEDNNKSNVINTLFEKPAYSTEGVCEDKIEESKAELISGTDLPADDDFGDFNDFQSSPELQPSTENEEIMDYPLLNLKEPMNKLIETVNSVIYSVFEEEMPEPEKDIEGNLDGELGVTWGYLLQTDERQPYMVNWNSSLGQKTLLKALCIDSRNILFGPKWSYNMPKYAATLSAAPLQPQKQVSSPSTSQVETITEKSACKPAGAWADPFTSDGQESCNPDAPSENPVIETGPTDLDVFEASTSSKPDKIFSSTLNVQPLRQISLPDTHIFTPTDSETPRSTTIHYDSRSTVLLPQTVLDTTNSEPSFKSEPQTSIASTADNDEYWEFQDFKGPPNPITSSASIVPQKSETSKDNPNIVYATQVLQPVKVEPIIPKLNWPDPGEVKETFDDFSDFISNSSLSIPQQQTPIVPVQKIDSKPNNEPVFAGPSKTVVTGNEVVLNDTSGDDDFDTFQSAQPSTSSVDFNCTSVSNVSKTVGGSTIISPQTPPQTLTDFNFAFPKVESLKPNTISIENVIKQKDSFVQNTTTFFPSHSEVKIPPVQASSSGLNTSLLQPTPASMSGSTPSQQKSAQILQPLSLESFSQINWPNPGIDLQDLSRFNPVETLRSLKSDLSVNSQSNKVASPVHSQKNQKSAASNQPADDDWGEFVSSKPKPQPQTLPKKQTTFADDDEWTDFVSSPSVKPQNGLNTISLNVHTNFQSKPSNFSKGSKVPIEIPSLNYITPKSNHKSYSDRHFQNL